MLSFHRTIVLRFESQRRDKTKPFFHHFTTAIDTHNIRFVFDAVKDTILHENLHQLMLQWHQELVEKSSEIVFFFFIFYFLKFYFSHPPPPIMSRRHFDYFYWALLHWCKRGSNLWLFTFGLLQFFLFCFC